MSYAGESGESSAVAVPWPDMHTVRMSSGTVGSFIATGALTQGRYGLYRWDMPPKADGAGGHFHRTFSEAFYVLHGAPSFWNGETWTTAGPGFYLHVPEGGIHGFRNDSDGPASFLILFAPGAMREGYFLALAESASSGRTMTKPEFEALRALRPGQRRVAKRSVRRIVAVVVVMAVLLEACLPPSGRPFQATVGVADDLPLLVTLGDQTGLVEGIEPAWIDDPPPIRSFTVAGGGSPHELVVLWAGGLCDDEAVFSFAATASGYAMHLEVRRKFGSCQAGAVVRSLRIELSKPVDPNAVTLSGEG